MATFAPRGFSIPNPLAPLINDHNYQWWATVPVIMAMFIVIMDSSIVNVALPHMMAAFGSSVEDIEWVSTGYMLSSAIMMPTTGFLSDRFGRKRIYWMCILAFTIISMFCGAAWDNGSLVFFRVLQGVVGGAIQPIGQAILYEAFPPEQRGMSMAIVGMGAMLAPMLGPTLGGYLVDYINWRWIFYVNLIPGIMAALLAVMVLREAPLRLVKFDAVGFYSMALFLSTLLLGVSQGDSKGWSSDYIIALFVVAAISFAAFLIAEFWRTHPVVELRLYKYATYTAGTIVSIVVGIALFGGTFLLPLFLQNLMGYDAITTGLIMMPSGLAVGIMMPVAGRLMNKVDPRLMMTIGLLLMGYSLYLQGTMTTDTSILEIVWWTILRGFGMGLVFPTMSQTTLAAVPIQQIGQASGLFNVTRQIGGSFGIAALSTLLTQRTIYHQTMMGTNAAHTGQAALVIGQLKASLMAHGASAMMAQQQAQAIFGATAMKTASMYGFQDAFWVAAMLAFLGIIPVLFVRRTWQVGGSKEQIHVAME
ncbi:MAG TPA: DHA2 family efflux MFS transporter permease subunit [Oscillatoriaceae cyanobacterium]